MSNIYDTHRTDFSIHGELLVTGLASQTLGIERNVETPLMGLWRMVLCMPAERTHKAKILLHISPDASKSYPGRPEFTIAFKFLRLRSDDMVDGPSAVCHWQFHIIDLNSSYTLLCASSITWDALWCRTRADEWFSNRCRYKV